MLAISNARNSPTAMFKITEKNAKKIVFFVTVQSLPSVNALAKFENPVHSGAENKLYFVNPRHNITMTGIKTNVKNKIIAGSINKYPVRFSFLFFISFLFRSQYYPVLRDFTGIRTAKSPSNRLLYYFKFANDCFNSVSALVTASCAGLAPEKTALNIEFVILSRSE